MSYKAFYLGFTTDGVAGAALAIFFCDSTGAASTIANMPLTINTSDTLASLTAAIPALVAAYAISNVGITVSSDAWLFSPNSTPKSFSTPTRALDTAFQPSTASDTFGAYSVSISCTLSLSGGQSGSLVLEYADDSGFTTNVKTVSTASNSNTGTLTLGLNTVGLGGAVVSGIIPKSKFARIRHVNVTGTPTNVLVGSSEVQF